MEKKKILFILPDGCLPVPAVMGGAVETLLTMLIKQNEKNPTFEFYFLMSKTKNEKSVKDVYLYTHLYQHSTSMIERKLFRYVNFINKKLKYKIPMYLPYNTKVIRSIKQIDPDFIIYEGNIDASIKHLRRSKYKDKIFLHVHHQFSDKSYINANVTNLIAVSNFIKEDWLKTNDKANIQVLQNAIDTKFFDVDKVTDEVKKNLKQKLGLRDKDYVIIYTGRLNPVKGVLELVQAVSQINDENIKLLIVGGINAGSKVNTNSYVQKLMNYSKNDKIIFTGFVSYNKLVNYYAIANLQVVPTLCEEASCMVAIEGNYCGLPQIVTNSGGMPENCSSSTIIIDKSGDVINQLKEAILKVKNEKIKNKKDIKALTAKDYYNEFVKVMKEFEREVCDDKNTKCKEE